MKQISTVDYTPQLSQEKDEHGKKFVLSKDGTTTFGRMESESGLADVPIKLSEGIITNPVTKEGYGLVHIEARHGDQIRNAGFSTVVDFVEEVAKNYEVIREGIERNGNQTYLLQLTDKNNNTLIVELSGDETYWNINTAGIFRTSYGAKNKVVYNRHATEKQSAETVEASLSGEQDGTTPSTSMNASIQQNILSDGKDSKNTDTLQEKSKKLTKINNLAKISFNFF